MVPRHTYQDNLQWDSSQQSLVQLFLDLELLFQDGKNL